MDTESYTDKIKTFVSESNYHAAFNIAVSGLNEGRSTDNQSAIDQFVSIIKAISIMVATEYGSKEYLEKEKSDVHACFICGATKERAELLPGVNGAICGKCAESAYAHFKGE